MPVSGSNQKQPCCNENNHSHTIKAQKRYLVMTYTSKSVLSLFLGLWFFNASGQDQGLLYKISGKGVKKTSYLFGTIHMICEDQFHISDVTSAAFDNAEKLVLEIDLSASDLQLQMMQHSMDQEGADWVQQFTTEQVEAIDAMLLETIGASILDLGQFKPFSILSMLTQAKFECEKVGSYELHLVEAAKQQEKPVIGLETVAEQFAIFDSIPQEEQIEELLRMVLNPETYDNELAQLTEKYVAGDLDGLFEVMLANSQMGDYQNLLLDDRNERWIPILQKEFKKNSLFIAVGAGHLPGEKGVIQLLRNAGYTVEAVLD